MLHVSIKSHSVNTQLHVNLGKFGSYFWEVLTQRGRKTYISFNAQFWKMQQKLPKWAKSIKPCVNEAILILFAPKCSVEFSLKALMPSEVIQKYWKLKEKQFLPLGVVLNYALLNISDKPIWPFATHTYSSQVMLSGKGKDWFIARIFELFVLLRHGCNF